MPRINSLKCVFCGASWDCAGERPCDCDKTYKKVMEWVAQGQPFVRNSLRLLADAKEALVLLRPEDRVLVIKAFCSECGEESGCNHRKR